MNISLMILAASVTFAEGGPSFDGEPSTNTVDIQTLEDFEKSGLDVVYIDTNKSVNAVRPRTVEIPESEYMVLTSNFAKVWSAMHSTEDGRIRVHGMRKSQIVTDTQKLTTYADGYTHAEPLVKKRVPREPKSRTNAVRRVERKIDGSKRYREYVEKMRERNARRFKEISIERDAVTGKDIVK